MLVDVDRPEDATQVVLPSGCQPVVEAWALTPRNSGSKFFRAATSRYHDARLSGCLLVKITALDDPTIDGRSILASPRDYHT